MNTVFFSPSLEKERERSVNIFHVLKLFQTHSGHAGIRRRFFRRPFAIFWNLGGGGQLSWIEFLWLTFFSSFVLIFLSEAENKQGELFCVLCVDRRHPTTVASQSDWLAAQEFLGGLLYLAVAEALDHGFSWASAAVRSYQVYIFLLWWDATMHGGAKEWKLPNHFWNEKYEIAGDQE